MSVAIAYDSHCHLEHINTLTEHTAMAIVVAVNLTDTVKLVSLREQSPIYKIGFGVHPWFIDDLAQIDNLVENLTGLVKTHKPDFIGEIGLDKYKPDFTLQTRVFETQLLIAREFNIPVIIHCVRAYNEVLAILKRHNITRGIIHGFNANEVIARGFYTQGFLLGIGANITKASLIAKDINKIPIQYLVLESDAPYMPAFAKQSSSSSDCFLYAQVLSGRLNINLIDIINQSNQNQLRILNQL